MAMSVQTYEEYDYDLLNLYAGVDCVVTLELLRRLMPKVDAMETYIKYEKGTPVKTKVLSIWQEMQRFKLPAHEYIIDMEINGFKYNIEGNRAMDKAMRDEMAELEKEIYKAIGKQINLDSSQELSEYLYKELKLPVYGRTKGGQPSTDGDALHKLRVEHGIEWLDTLRKRNDIASVHSSFIATYVKDWVKHDGRIHPQYNLTGTSSHRISSDSPNLLNLPRMCYNHNIRSLYTVDEGNVLLAFDFSSCEVKVLGALSRDPKLLKAIEEGKDFHSVTACGINGLDYDHYLEVLHDKSHPDNAKYKDMRQGAKAVTFGILYGSSVHGIAAGLGIEVEEAQRLINMYFDTYPLIKEYVENSHKMAERNHWIVTPFGQRKQQFGTLPPYTRTAVFNAAKRNAQNVRIQSTASTLGLMAFTELNTQLKPLGGKAVCTVYDSCEFEIPIRHAAEAVEVAFRCMDDWPVKQFDWLELPIGTDGEIGFDWGNMEDVHRGVTQEEIDAMLIELNREKYNLAMAA